MLYARQPQPNIRGMAPHNNACILSGIQYPRYTIQLAEHLIYAKFLHQIYTDEKGPVL